MDININKLINELVSERVKSLIAANFATEINALVQANITNIKKQLELQTTTIEPRVVISPNTNITFEPDSVLTADAAVVIQQTALSTFDQDKDMKPRPQMKTNQYMSTTQRNLDIIEKTDADTDEINPITDKVLLSFAHDIAQLKQINNTDIDQHYERVVNTNMKKNCIEDPKDKEYCASHLENLGRTIDSNFNAVELVLRPVVNKLDDTVNITQDRKTRHERLNKDHKSGLDVFINNHANDINEATQNVLPKDNPLWHNGITTTTKTPTSSSISPDTPIAQIATSSTTATVDNVVSYHDRHFC